MDTQSNTSPFCPQCSGRSPLPIFEPNSSVLLPINTALWNLIVRVATFNSPSFNSARMALTQAELVVLVVQLIEEDLTQKLNGDSLSNRFSCIREGKYGVVADSPVCVVQEAQLQQDEADPNAWRKDYQSDQEGWTNIEDGFVRVSNDNEIERSVWMD